MSAHFILRYRGTAVRIVPRAGHTDFELVADERATPFISEADALTAAVRFRLDPDFCEVKPAGTGNAKLEIQN